MGGVSAPLGVPPRSVGPVRSEVGDGLKAVVMPWNGPPVVGFGGAGGQLLRQKRHRAVS